MTGFVPIDPDVIMPFDDCEDCGDTSPALVCVACSRVVCRGCSETHDYCNPNVTPERSKT